MSGYTHLAYGFDLGPTDAPKCGPKDDHDELDLPWWDPDDDDLGFADCVADALKEAGITGVEIVEGGHCDYPAQMLVVTASHKQVEWPSALVLDLSDMEHPPEGAFDLLTSAVEALGLVPDQHDPRWLAFLSFEG